MDIKALGYIGFESPNLDQWEQYATDVLGLAVGPSSPDGTLYLRMDDRRHRIAIHPGAQDGLRCLGWEVVDREAFDTAVEELKHWGYSPELAESDLLEERGVQGLARFSDPAGFPHEIFYAQRFEPGSFRPGRAMFGKFLAGHLGIGHAVMIVPEVTEELTHFARAVLGLRVFNDYDVTLPSTGERGRVVFYRCNPRSHAIGYIGLPGKSGLHHFCIEVQELDDVGVALDRAVDAEVPITLTLGRHQVDPMISFYMRTPGGFDLEYGQGGLMIDDDWRMGRPTRPHSWGQRNGAPYLGMPTTVHDVGA
jgi:extradiol dioxygenase